MSKYNLSFLNDDEYIIGVGGYEFIQSISRKTINFSKLIDSIKKNII